MPTEAKVGAFEDEERANRTVRWLRRSGLRARIDRVGDSFEVIVPSSREGEARRVLEAVDHTRQGAELAEPTGWGRVRNRLLNLENVGMTFAVIVGAAMLLFVGISVWAYAGLIGWVALVIVLAAGLVLFGASGFHSAVKAPRASSGKHYLTQGEEQEVQYRLAWVRGQYQKSRRWNPRQKPPRAEALAGEETSIVTPEELMVLRSRRRRWSAVWAARRKWGKEAAGNLRQLQTEQLELARMIAADEEPLSIQRSEISNARLAYDASVDAQGGIVTG